MSRSKTWQHELTAFDGDATLFGVNIFDYDWDDTQETVTIRDPLYDQEHEFRIFTAVINGQKHEFAAGEFSNCVWGFYLLKG